MNKKIYFAGSIRGGRNYADLCHRMIEHIQKTNMERTVCDAVKYRNKIGLDVCGEVINNYLKKEKSNITLLHEYAQKLRVKNILTKYLETRL